MGHFNGGMLVEHKTETPCSLADFFLFQKLSAKEQQTIAAQLPPARQYRRGEAVYRSEDYQHAVGLILRGSVTVTGCTGGKHALLMNRLGKGDAFGVAALFGNEGDTYVTEITAQSDTDILFLSQDCMSELFIRFPVLAENYIRFLSDRIRFLNRKIAALTDGNATSRLYQYLLTHRTEQGELQLPDSMAALARTLNMGRSSLYRSLDALVNEGILEKHDTHYTMI